jgi:3-hydroxyisobutyrate dehydrogenase-like beta-hydroxyacid dehydrogenase
MSSITIIGAGLMGSALARAFSAAGHDVNVWNRTFEHAKAVGEGTVAVESLTDAVRDREIVMISVSTYDAASEILSQEGVAEALRGSTIVQITSGAPSDARRGLTWAQENGVGYLDAAILAYPAFVATEYATVFYSGDSALFDRLRPTLVAIAENTVYMGEAIGAANTIDCAILTAYYGGSLAVLQGAQMCAAEGLGTDQFFAYKDAYVGLVAITSDAAAPMVAQGDYSGNQCSIDTHVGAIRHLLALSKDAGISSQLPQHLFDAYSKAQQAGYGKKELPAVFETLRAD